MIVRLAVGGAAAVKTVWIGVMVGIHLEWRWPLADHSKASTSRVDRPLALPTSTFAGSASPAFRGSTDGGAE